MPLAWVQLLPQLPWDALPFGERKCTAENGKINALLVLREFLPVPAVCDKMEQNVRGKKRVAACCGSPRMPIWDLVPIPEAASHLGSIVFITAGMPAGAAGAILQWEEEALHWHLVKFKLKPARGWWLDSLPVGKKVEKNKIIALQMTFFPWVCLDSQGYS